MPTANHISITFCSKAWAEELKKHGFPQNRSIAYYGAGDQLVFFPDGLGNEANVYLAAPSFEEILRDAVRRDASGKTAPQILQSFFTWYQNVDPAYFDKANVDSIVDASAAAYCKQF